MRARWTLRELEDLVLRLRKRWGIEFDSVPDLLKVLLDVFPREYPGFRLLIVPDDELPHARAATEGASNTIKIRKSVADAGARLERTTIYILAEEIGHFVLKHEGIRHRRADNRDVYRVARIGRDDREARQFASILLSPWYLAAKCLSVEEIEQEFPLSRFAATLRLRELNDLRLQETGKTKQSPQEVIDFLKQAALRGRPVAANTGTRFDIEIDLNMPAEGAAPIVNIEHSSSKARYRIWGYASDGNLIFIELQGGQTRVRLPFVRNKILVQSLSGGIPTKIVAVDSVELEPVHEMSFERTARYVAARASGYYAEPCPDCGKFKLVSDGNCKKCTECFWNDSTTG